MAERVVKFKVLVFDKFGDPIDFVPAIMHDDVRIRDRNDIDFTTRQFSLENRTFLDDYVDLELVCWDMLLHREG